MVTTTPESFAVDAYNVIVGVLDIAPGLMLVQEKRPELVGAIDWLKTG